MRCSRWDSEKFNWESTGEKYVYRCTETGKYHFIDETENFMPNEYETEALAVDALMRYAEQL